MNTEDFASKIPENLSAIRKQQRYTQKEVADMAGLNPNYYAKVERGDGIPSIKSIHKLARALKVTATEIVGF